MATMMVKSWKEYEAKWVTGVDRNKHESIIIVLDNGQKFVVVDVSETHTEGVPCFIATTAQLGLVESLDNLHPSFLEKRFEREEFQQLSFWPDQEGVGKLLSDDS